jgi:hypothetical protein
MRGFEGDTLLMRVKRVSRETRGEEPWFLSGHLLLALRRYICNRSAAFAPAEIITLTLNSIFICCLAPYTDAFVQPALRVVSRDGVGLAGWGQNELLVHYYLTHLYSRILASRLGSRDVGPNCPAAVCDRIAGFAEQVSLFVKKFSPGLFQEAAYPRIPVKTKADRDACPVCLRIGGSTKNSRKVFGALKLI